MMSDLDDLYQEVILDHSKNPRNYGDLKGTGRRAVGHNPLCGDQLILEASLDGSRIQEVRFTGAGCSIFKSSASMMTEAVKGKTREEVDALYEKFHHLISRPPDEEVDSDGYGSLAAFSGVCEFPVRVKCAALPWHTLRSALGERGNAVTTE